MDCNCSGRTSEGSVRLLKGKTNSQDILSCVHKGSLCAEHWSWLGRRDIDTLDCRIDERMIPRWQIVITCLALWTYDVLQPFFSFSTVPVHSCFCYPFHLVLLLLMNAHTHNVDDSSSAICKAVILLYPSALSVALSFLVLDLMTVLNSTIRQSTLNYNPLHTSVQRNWPSHILQLLPLDIAKCNYGRKYMASSYVIDFEWLPYQLYCNSTRWWDLYY